MVKKNPSFTASSIFHFFRGKFKNENKGLFEGNDAAFKEILEGCKVYGEYGCGQSTLWVAANTSASIYSVDSSQVWIDNVKNAANDRRNIHIRWIDVGDLGNWGRPLSYEKRESFNQYTDWIWSQAIRPDCVLVDGRFRVACFLTSLLNAEIGTKIIFDDYVNRRHYHIVEELLPRNRESGRQAVFIVPSLSMEQRKMAEALLDKFRYVME